MNANVILAMGIIALGMGVYFAVPTLSEIPFQKHSYNTSEQDQNFLHNYGQYNQVNGLAFSQNRTPNSSRMTMVWGSVKIVCTTLVSCDAQINATVINQTGNSSIAVAGIDGNNIGIVGASLSTQQTITFFVPANNTYQLITQTNAGTATYTIQMVKELSL